MYFTRESPLFSGLLSNPPAGKKLNGLFNWTMTYKLDSDIDYRYFRRIELYVKLQKIPRVVRGKILRDHSHV